jgi:hypothetical protein
MGEVPWVRLLVVIGSMIFIGLVIYPMFTASQSPAPANVEENHLKGISILLQDYAREHNGNFPAKLSDIAIPPGLAEMAHFHDPTTKTEANWIYYSGHIGNDPSDTVLAASPEFDDKGTKMRLVTDVDGLTKTIKASDFKDPAQKTQQP